eukprot:TRINITY_DN10852_c0_g3_i2.p1 TRINITY_DN10852_c0_g3~~TRINITY_DN10852_c0_g3_i2.p1  ORF type:complete len:336 (+),score=59.33 TRINITY_DN10852_c0_g3_i2:79-1086(+)
MTLATKQWHLIVGACAAILLLAASAGWLSKSNTATTIPQVDYETCPESLKPNHHLEIPAEPSSHECDLSMEQSNGYICDSNRNWERRVGILRNQAARCDPSPEATKSCSAYLQTNFEPSLSCSFEERVGDIGDGGKWTCDPYRINELHTASSKTCAIMSIGSNDEFGFEQGVHCMFGSRCRISTFDHTVKKPHPPSYVNYHSIGISAEPNGNVQPLNKLVEIALKGLDPDAVVEILKIDVEGFEYESLTKLLLDDHVSFKWPRQINIELHIGSKYGRHQGVPEVHALLSAFQQRGYAVFHKEPNVQYAFKAGHNCAIEYSLIKLNMAMPALPVLE